MVTVVPEEQEHIARAVLDFIDSRDGKHPLVPWRVMLSRQDAVPVDRTTWVSCCEHNRGHDDRQRHWRNNIAWLGGVASAETERSPGSRSTTHARPAVKAQIFPVRTASKFHHGTCSPLMSEPHSPKLAEAALFLHLFTCRCKHCGRLILPSNADFQFVAQSCSSYILESQWHSDTFLAQGECVLLQLDIAHGSALIVAWNQPGILQSAF